MRGNFSMKGKGSIMKLNPIYQKELKTSVRTMRTAFIILGYNGLLALFGLFAFFITFRYDARDMGIIQYADILDIYAIIAATEFGLVLFAIPALTSASISGEREKQTLEILLTTNVSPLKIITGKLASSISMMVLLAISSLPILGLVFSIGGVSLKDLLAFVLLIIVTAIFVGSIGMFFSTLFKKTTLATVSTYGALLFLTLGTLAILWGVSVIYELNMPAITTLDTVYKEKADIGNALLLLVVNPAITCFSMIESQVGTGRELYNLFDNFGRVEASMFNNWFYISIGVQLFISTIFILLSGRLLNPLKKKR